MMLTLNPNLPHRNLTVQAPAWDNLVDDPTVIEDFDIPVDTFSCDNFRMYEFKIRKCARVRSHDWTECPFAHPGEKARRRDPSKHRYNATICCEFKTGVCSKGDSCEFSHGVFECWLHPLRYRTQPCKDGTRCKRRVCFFAHTPEQLRIVTTQTGGELTELTQSDSPPMSPHNVHACLVPGQLSPATESTRCDSPPMSPLGFRVPEKLHFLSSFHGPESNRSDSVPLSPFSTHIQNQFSPVLSRLSPGSESTRSASPMMSPLEVHSLDQLYFSPSRLVHESVSGLADSMSRLSMSAPGLGNGRFMARPKFTSLPSTPSNRPAGPRTFDMWERVNEEEPVMERVESGRDLRARMYAKLGRENSMDGPDMSWISELVN